MAKTKLIDLSIDGIPAGEAVLREGVMSVMSLYTTNKNRYFFKYVLTEKGIWTKGRGFLFIKGKEGFLSYDEISSYRENKYLKSRCYIFNPKNGKKPANRIFFDDSDAAEEILSRFLKKESN